MFPLLRSSAVWQELYIYLPLRHSTWFFVILSFRSLFACTRNSAYPVLPLNTRTHLPILLVKQNCRSNLCPPHTSYRLKKANYAFASTLYRGFCLQEWNSESPYSERNRKQRFLLKRQKRPSNLWRRICMQLSSGRSDCEQWSKLLYIPSPPILLSGIFWNSQLYINFSTLYIDLRAVKLCTAKH